MMETGSARGFQAFGGGEDRRPSAEKRLQGAEQADEAKNKSFLDVERSSGQAKFEESFYEYHDVLNMAGPPGSGRPLLGQRVLEAQALDTEY